MLMLNINRLSQRVCENRDIDGWLVAWGLCYTEKAPNAWQRRGTQKTRNTYMGENNDAKYRDVNVAHE